MRPKGLSIHPSIPPSIRPLRLRKKRRKRRFVPGLTWWLCADPWWKHLLVRPSLFFSTQPRLLSSVLTLIHSLALLVRRQSVERIDMRRRCFAFFPALAAMTTGRASAAAAARMRRRRRSLVVERLSLFLEVFVVHHHRRRGGGSAGVGARVGLVVAAREVMSERPDTVEIHAEKSWVLGGGGKGGRYERYEC